MPDLSGGLELPSDLPDLGEGIAGVILGILAWVLFSVLLLLFIWLFGAIVWTMILVFAAMLYWIFFSCTKTGFQKFKQMQRQPDDKYRLWTWLHRTL